MSRTRAAEEHLGFVVGGVVVFNWRSDPSDWPAGMLLGVAGVCALPPPALAVAGQGAAAAAWAVAGVAVWGVLGARTRPGFPYLFDTLGLWGLGSSGCVLLWATARGLKALATP